MTQPIIHDERPHAACVVLSAKKLEARTALLRHQERRDVYPTVIGYIEEALHASLSDAEMVEDIHVSLAALDVVLAEKSAQAGAAAASVRSLHGLHPEDDGITLCGLYLDLLPDGEGIAPDRDRLSCTSCRAALVVPAYVPEFGEPGYPGCPGCGKSVGSHAEGCSEDES